MAKKTTGWRGPVGSNKGVGFDANPENINKEGRPRKAFSSFNAELDKAGIEAVNKTNFREALLRMFNLTEDELTDVSNDEEQTQALRIMANELLQPKTRARYLAEVRDWSLGGVERTTNINAKVASAEVVLPVELEEQIQRSFEDYYGDSD